MRKPSAAALAASLWIGLLTCVPAGIGRALAETGCNPESTERWLKQGFTPQQIVEMCTAAAPATAPAEAAKVSKTPSLTEAESLRRQIATLEQLLHGAGERIRKAREDGAKCRADAERRAAENTKLSGSPGVASTATLATCSGFDRLADSLAAQQASHQSQLAQLRFKLGELK